MCRLTLVCLLSLVTLAVAADVQPARLASASVPLPPPQTVGWLEVVLHISVSETGKVHRIETLRATRPLADMLRGAVQNWSFQPALENGEAVEAHVLVAAVYRPATLFNPPTLRELPGDLVQPSGGAPLPTFAPPPAYPPTALGDGAVLVEVLVGTDGDVQAATVVRSGGTAFDASAIRSAQQWRFHPALRQGLQVPAIAYLVFGFRQPVVSVTPR